MRDVADGEAGAISPVCEEELVSASDEELVIIILLDGGAELYMYSVKVEPWWRCLSGESSISTYL